MMFYLKDNPFKEIEKEFFKSKQIKSVECNIPSMEFALRKDWSRGLFADIINQRIILAAFIGSSKGEVNVLYLTPGIRHLSSKEKCALLLSLEDGEVFEEKKSPYMNEKEVSKEVEMWKSKYQLSNLIGIVVTERGFFKTPFEGVNLNEIVLNLYEEIS